MMNTVQAVTSLVPLCSMALLCLARRDKVMSYPFGVSETKPLRGLLAICLIANHADYRLFAWGGLIVCIFFFLSSYGLMKSYLTKGDAYLQGFLSKRLSAILIPFFVAMVAFHLITLTTAGTSAYNPHMQEVLFRGDTTLILPYSWFIFAIILIYIAFYLAWRMSGNIRKLICVFTILEFAFVAFLMLIPRFGGQWAESAFALPMGMCLALYEDRVSNYLTRYSATLSVALLFVTLAIVVASLYVPHTGYILNLFVPALVYMFIRTCSIKCLFIDWLGSISLELYLVHGIVIFSMRRLFESNHAIAIVSIFVSIASAYLLSISCKRLRSII